MQTSAALIRSLLLLRSERRTGVLNVECEGAKTFVYLREGVLVFAEEGSHGETLGRLLLRQRVLKQEQYATVIAKMTDALVLNEQLRFGELAVELGYLTEEQVRKALYDQIRWKIVRAFQRIEVSWTFEDSESRLDEIRDFPMRIEALVLDAMRWMDDEDKLQLVLGGALEQVVRLQASDAATLPARFELTPEEARFLAVLDCRTVRAALATREAREIDAPAVLSALLVTRAVHTAAEPRLARPATPVVEIRIEPAPVSRPPRRMAAQPAGPKPQPVAPLQRPPTPAANRQPQPAAPLQRPPTSAASQQPQQQRAPQPSSPSFDQPPIPKITHAKQILEALAAQRVTVDLTRKPLDEHEAKLLAERSCQDGLALLEAGRYAQAAPAFARATQLLAESHEYKLYARWSAAKARGAPALGQQDRAELVKLAVTATKADPNFAFGFYVAGACALDEGDAKSAYRLLSRAHRLGPDLLDCQRLLRMAERAVEPGDEPKGLFSRDLFGGERSERGERGERKK